MVENTLDKVKSYYKEFEDVSDLEMVHKAICELSCDTLSCIAAGMSMGYGKSVIAACLYNLAHVAAALYNSETFSDSQREDAEMLMKVKIARIEDTEKSSAVDEMLNAVLAYMTEDGE